MAVFFNFAARVILVWQKATFDRLRPDDSVLTLICELGRFNNEIVRDALKDLVDQFWSGYAIGDGAVGVDAPAAGGVSVGKPREAVVPYDADPSVRASELPDHALRDLDRTVDDVVLADRVHAVDGQTVISVEACPGDHGRLERIALLARQAMIVAGCIHIEMSVQQVVDVHLLRCSF